MYISHIYHIYTYDVHMHLSIFFVGYVCFPCKFKFVPKKKQQTRSNESNGWPLVVVVGSHEGIPQPLYCLVYWGMKLQLPENSLRVDELGLCQFYEFVVDFWGLSGFR